MSDHYAEAERYLELARKFENADDVRFHLMGAQVHATLATVQRDTRTIPWPPGDGLVEWVARTLAALDGRPWDALLPIHQDDYRAKARAVLDAIGGDRR